MKPGTYVVYTMSVSRDTYTVRHVLNQVVPDSAIKQIGESLVIPRIVTFWRGDTEERTWQEARRKAMYDADPDAVLSIESAEWTPAPGYPRGDL